MNAPDESTRRDALFHLDTFCSRILPGTVRRIAFWKQLRSAHLPDLVDEVRQELAVDCLQNAALVAGLPDAERNARWMRLAERWIYHHLIRSRGEAVHEHIPAPPMGTLTQQPLLSFGVSLTNGRWNMTRSAASSGRRMVNLRRDLDRLVEDLGFDVDYDAFWRARLAEAMTGLAADLLRERGAVQPLPRTRRAPDPRSRLRRIRAIGARFPVRHSTIDVRRMLRPWMRTATFDDDTPMRLLTNAVTLSPYDASGWMWMFEANVARRDVRGALRAIRSARRCRDRSRTAITLARARLLEVRGRLAAALALLRRATKRWPRDHRLVTALASASRTP